MHTYYYYYKTLGFATISTPLSHAHCARTRCCSSQGAQCPSLQPPLLINMFLLPMLVMAAKQSQRNIGEEEQELAPKEIHQLGCFQLASVLSFGDRERYLRMVRAGRTARALCLLCLALLLLAQYTHSRKLLLQEKHSHGHGHGVGNGNGTTTTQEPSRENGGSTDTNNNGQLQFDSAKWEELHTDYIYTQDIKNP